MSAVPVWETARAQLPSFGLVLLEVDGNFFPYPIYFDDMIYHDV